MLPRDPVALLMRDTFMWVIAAIAAVAFVAIALKLILPRRRC